jgi:hypothetical protein
VIEWFHNAGAGKGVKECDCTYCQHKHPCKKIPATIKTDTGYDIPKMETDTGYEIHMYFPCDVCALHTPCGEYPLRTKCECPICDPKEE